MRFDDEIWRILGINIFSGFSGGIFKGMTSKKALRAKEVIRHGLIGMLLAIFIAPLLAIILIDNSLINSGESFVRYSAYMFIGFMTGFGAKEAAMLAWNKVFKNGNNKDDGNSD